MTTCWFGKKIPSKAAKRWLPVFLILFFATAGCQHATEDGDGTEEQSSALFVDFERYYEAPQESSYLASEGVRVVNPNADERLPLVIEEDAKKLSAYAIGMADVREEDNVIRFPRQGFEAAADVKPDDVIISGLHTDDFWVTITAVEVFDETIVWHTQEAQIDDVVKLGEFHLEVDDGYGVPEGFNLLDVYLSPKGESGQLRTTQQAQSSDCLVGVAEDIINDYPAVDNVAFVGGRLSTYQSKRNNHNNWLATQRANEPGRDAEFAAAMESCTPEVGWSKSAAQSAYSPGDTPPSMICREHWFRDELEEYARDAFNAPNESVEGLCDMAEGEGEGSDHDDLGGVGEEMSNMFETQTDLASAEFGGDLTDTEDLCHQACGFADDPDTCKQGCPSFEQCFSNFCFELTEISVSYSPSVSLSISLGLLDPSAKLEVGGPLTLRLGALLSAEYNFSWDKTHDFYFPIPYLGFTLGPLSFGFVVYADFGISFSFDAEATLEATYEKTFNAGAYAKLALSGPSAGHTFAPIDEDFDINVSGSISAQFQAWAGAGLAFVIGFGNSSGGVLDEMPGGRIFWVEPIKAVFSASASIAPPQCPYDVGIHIGGYAGYDISFGFGSFSDEFTIWGPKYLARWQGDLHEFIDPLKYLCGDDSDNAFSPPSFEDFDEETHAPGCAAGHNECGDGTCVGGNCVDGGEADLRMTLSWTELVDLNLVVIDPSGDWHTVNPLPMATKDNFTRWDCGNVCDDQRVGGYNFIENAVFENPQTGVYRFYVMQNKTHETDIPDDTSFTYEVELAHDGVTEVVGGRMDPEYEEMPVMFEYCVGGEAECPFQGVNGSN